MIIAPRFRPFSAQALTLFLIILPAPPPAAFSAEKAAGFSLAAAESSPSSRRPQRRQCLVFFSSFRHETPPLDFQAALSLFGISVNVSAPPLAGVSAEPCARSLFAPPRFRYLSAEFAPHPVCGFFNSSLCPFFAGSAEPFPFFARSSVPRATPFADFRQPLAPPRLPTFGTKSRRLDTQAAACFF